MIQNRTGQERGNDPGQSQDSIKGIEENRVLIMALTPSKCKKALCISEYCPHTVQVCMVGNLARWQNRTRFFPAWLYQWLSSFHSTPPLHCSAALERVIVLPPADFLLYYQPRPSDPFLPTSRPLISCSACFSFRSSMWNSKLLCRPTQPPPYLSQY